MYLLRLTKSRGSRNMHSTPEDFIFLSELGIYVGNSYCTEFLWHLLHSEDIHQRIDCQNCVHKLLENQREKARKRASVKNVTKTGKASQWDCYLDVQETIGKFFLQTLFPGLALNKQNKQTKMEHLLLNTFFILNWHRDWRQYWSDLLTLWLMLAHLYTRSSF